jgi:hypothetical protein
LKYELISRARRADRVTRLNFDKVRFIRLSSGGFIMVSSVATWGSFHFKIGGGELQGTPL